MHRAKPHSNNCFLKIEPDHSVGYMIQIGKICLTNCNYGFYIPPDCAGFYNGIAVTHKTRWVCPSDGIVAAICKTVVSALCTGNNRDNGLIPIDKSTGIGVIIAGLQVVQAGFGIIVVAAVAEGIDQGDQGCVGNGTGTPGVVAVATNGLTQIVEDLHHIALQIFQEVGSPYLNYTPFLQKKSISPIEKAAPGQVRLRRILNTGITIIQQHNNHSII